VSRGNELDIQARRCITAHCTAFASAGEDQPRCRKLKCYTFATQLQGYQMRCPSILTVVQTKSCIAQQAIPILLHKATTHTLIYTHYCKCHRSSLSSSALSLLPLDSLRGSVETSNIAKRLLLQPAFNQRSPLNPRSKQPPNSFYVYIFHSPDLA
jgi:hypothetical protein